MGLGNIAGEILIHRDGPACEVLAGDTIETGFLVERQNASVFRGLTEPAPHIPHRVADGNRSRRYVSQLMEGAIEFETEDDNFPTEKGLATDRLRAVAQLPKRYSPAGRAAHARRHE